MNQKYPPSLMTRPRFLRKWTPYLMMLIAAVSAEASTSGKVLSICDATAVAEVTDDVKKITITYNGTNCHGNRTRTGVVVISMPKNSYWKDAGAVITISVQNLKIKRLGDGKSIIINGTKTITNVSGGLLKILLQEMKSYTISIAMALL